jgi:hypothetical protein
MSSINQLPPERDLPADRHTHLRTRVLTMIAEPAAGRRTAAGRPPARIAAAGLAAAACIAVTWVGISGPSSSGQHPDVYALGDNVLSPRTRDAGRKCLKLARLDEGYGAFVTWPADSPPTLLNHIEQPGRGAIVIYQVQAKILYCSIGPAVKTGSEPREFTTDGSGAAGLGVLDSSQWLPGPISLEHAVSTDREGGYVYAAGRVSARVVGVVLDDGAGHRSAARLAQGTFVILSDGRIKPGAGMLISYDGNGKETDRRPALDQPDGRCYTDPAGNLVNPTSNEKFEIAYTSSKARCKPAEPWSRRNSAQPTRQ